MKDAIESYMSLSPHTIDSHKTAGEALDLIRTHEVVYLPVVDGQKLAGVVSERDIETIAAALGVLPEELPVRDAMMRNVCVVERGAALRDVARSMAEYAYDLAVVVNKNRVVGVFTAADALRAVALLSCR